MYTQSLRHAGYQISTKQELMYQLCSSLRMKEGGVLCYSLLIFLRYLTLLQDCWLKRCYPSSPPVFCGLDSPSGQLSCVSWTRSQWMKTRRDGGCMRQRTKMSIYKVSSLILFWEDVSLFRTVAWYHSVFYHEVYRLRGPFWFRDAVLPVYRNSYDLVDNALSPLEEAALAHVLCSPEVKLVVLLWSL